MRIIVCYLRYDIYSLYQIYWTNDSYVKREGDDFLLTKKCHDRGAQYTAEIYLRSAKQIFDVSKHKLIKLNIVFTFHLVAVSWISYPFFFIFYFLICRIKMICGIGKKLLNRAVRLVFERRKTKAKATTLANHNRRKQHNKPIKTCSKYMKNLCEQTAIGLARTLATNYRAQ